MDQSNKEESFPMKCIKSPFRLRLLIHCPLWTSRATMVRLDPYRIKVAKSKTFFYTSRYQKLDQWNKTRIYPQPRTYKGAFEARRNEYFCRPEAHFNEIRNRISAAQSAAVTNPSPVHLVWRAQLLQARPWWEKVVMRRLGLHAEDSYERVLVPNTPHYNKLLNQVRHLIRIKALTFPDGIPTEKDIGAVKVCEHTGEVRISQQFKVSEERLCGDKLPSILESKSMKVYLRNTLGIFPGGGQT